MHPRDFQPLFQMVDGDPVARQDRVLHTIVDYRFFAPHKIAADELREREMVRAALLAASGDGATPRGWVLAALRHRLGAVLIAVGTRLQRGSMVSLDPTPGA